MTELTGSVFRIRKKYWNTLEKLKLKRKEKGIFNNNNNLFIRSRFYTNKMCSVGKLFFWVITCLAMILYFRLYSLGAPENPIICSTHQQLGNGMYDLNIKKPPSLSMTWSRVSQKTDSKIERFAVITRQIRFSRKMLRNQIEFKSQFVCCARM